MHSFSQQLKALKETMDSVMDTIHRPEIHEHLTAMMWHLDEVIQAYESL